MKPFFRWVGSKASQVDSVLALLPEKIDTYYEPFLGSGAVFLALAEQGRVGRAVLGDGSPDVAQTFEAVRDDPYGVAAGLADINRELNRVRTNPTKASAFYAVARQNILRRAEPPRLAALFLFLNQTAFNGLWRVNSKNVMNAPPDLARLAAWKPDPEPIKEASRLLKKCNAKIYYGDFSQTINPMTTSPGRRSAGYFDPPYLPETGSGFASYTSQPFKAQDFVDLAENIARAGANGSRVVLSSSTHPQVLSTLWSLAEQGELPGAWIDNVLSRRRVAADPSARGYREELLFAAGPVDGTWRA